MKKKKAGIVTTVKQSHVIIINIQCCAWNGININGQIFPKLLLNGAVGLQAVSDLDQLIPALVQV